MKTKNSARAAWDTLSRPDFFNYHPMIISKLQIMILVVGVLFSGVAASVYAEADKDCDVAPKAWENSELLASLGHYHLSNFFQKEVKHSSENETLEAVIANLVRQIALKQAPKAIPLTLREAIEIAIAANRDAQLVQLSSLQSEADRDKARTVYDPVFFTDSGYHKTNRPIDSLLDNGTDGTTGKDTLKENGWLTQTGIRQPLPTGGTATISYEADHLESNSDLVIPNPQYTTRMKLELQQSLLKEIGDSTNRTNIDLTELAYKQSVSEYKKSLSDVLRELSNYYWRYKYYYELEQISRTAVQEGEMILERLRGRHEQGLADLLDLDRADVSLQERKIQLLTDSKSTKTTLDQLKVLLGASLHSENYFATIEPIEPFHASVTIPDKGGIQKTALTKREEIAIAERNIKASDMKKHLADHLQLPTVDVKAGYSLNGLGKEYDNSFVDSMDEDQHSWNVGLVIEWPLLGRKSSLDLQKAMIAKRQAEVEYQRALEKVVYEVNSSFTEMTSSMDEVIAAERLRELSGKVVEREKTLFEMSRIDNQRILDAEDKYYAAARSYLRALFNLNTATLKLQWAQGILLDSLAIDN